MVVTGIFNSTKTINVVAIQTILVLPIFLGRIHVHRSIGEKGEAKEADSPLEWPVNKMGLSKNDKHWGEGTKKRPLPVTIQKMTNNLGCFTCKISQTQVLFYRHKLDFLNLQVI